MKKLFPLLFLFIAAFCHAQQQNTAYSPVDTIITDLNADKVNDTITAYGKPVGNGIDIGKFTKLTISINGRRTTYTARESWDTIHPEFAKVNKNDVVSPFVFVRHEGKCSYLFVFGYEYAGGPQEFLILKIKGDQQEMLFNNRLGYPKLLTDLNNDGRTELLAQEVPVILKVTDKGGIQTYSPFIVYSFFPYFEIDKALTETYNKEHYVWAGFRPDENIKVLCPHDGSTPKIIKHN